MCTLRSYSTKPLSLHKSIDIQLPCPCGGVWGCTFLSIMIPDNDDWKHWRFEQLHLNLYNLTLLSWSNSFGPWEFEHIRIIWMPTIDQMPNKVTWLVDGATSSENFYPPPFSEVVVPSTITWLIRHSIYYFALHTLVQALEGVTVIVG